MLLCSDERRGGEIMQVLQGCACLSSNAFLFVLVADKCSNNNLPDGVFRCRPSVLLVAIELDVTARKDLDVVIHASAPYRFSVIYTNHVSLVTLESRLWVESWLKFRCTPIAFASPCNVCRRNLWIGTPRNSQPHCLLLA